MVGLNRLLLFVGAGNPELDDSVTGVSSLVTSFENTLNGFSALQNSLWWSLLVLIIVYIIKHFAFKTPSIGNSIFLAIIEFPNDVCIAMIPVIIAWGSNTDKPNAGFYLVLFAIVLNTLVLLGRHHSALSYLKNKKFLRTALPILMYLFVIFFFILVYSFVSKS